MYIMNISITSFKWGEIKTSDGKIYKDAIISPYVTSEWDWKKDGTCHSPGISAKAIHDNIMLHNELSEFYTIILSTGINEKLKISKEALGVFSNIKHKYDLHILQSEKAVELYNKLIKNKKYCTVLLLHSTC